MLRYCRYSITHQWMWMPGILLLGQLCPKGSEATMYALLAGCHNLGNSGANMLGPKNTPD